MIWGRIHNGVWIPSPLGRASTGKLAVIERLLPNGPLGTHLKVANGFSIGLTG